MIRVLTCLNSSLVDVAVDKAVNHDRSKKGSTRAVAERQQAEESSKPTEEQLCSEVQLEESENGSEHLPPARQKPPSAEYPTARQCRFWRCQWIASRPEWQVAVSEDSELALTTALTLRGEGP